MKDELHLHRALYEVQEYRAIGTIEECRKAMELLKDKEKQNGQSRNEKITEKE